MPVPGNWTTSSSSDSRPRPSSAPGIAPLCTEEPKTNTQHYGQSDTLPGRYHQQEQEDRFAQELLAEVDSWIDTGEREVLSLQRQLLITRRLTNILLTFKRDQRPEAMTQPPRSAEDLWKDIASQVVRSLLEDNWLTPQSIPVGSPALQETSLPYQDPSPAISSPSVTLPPTNPNSNSS